MSAITLVIVRKLRGDDDGVPGVPDQDVGASETEFLHPEAGEPRVVKASADDRERTVISYGSEPSDTEAMGDTVVTGYDGDPGVTSYSEACQPPPWGHHGHGPRDTYNALLRTQGPSSGHSGHSPRVKLNPLFHQYS